MINQLFLIAMGGAVGSVLRYLTSTSIYALLGRSFPYGTLAVNVIGSFLMGFMTILLLERIDGMAPQLRSLLLIGFLGGFTTFSAFSLETFALIENGAVFAALLNIVLSVVLCLMSVWLGIVIGKTI